MAGFSFVCNTYFSPEVIYWREASSGHSRSAYFVGKILSTFFRLSLSALHFTTFYAILATPLMAFSTLYAANLLYFYCTLPRSFRAQGANDRVRHLWPSMLCINGNSSWERAPAGHDCEPYHWGIWWLWSSTLHDQNVASWVALANLSRGMFAPSPPIHDLTSPPPNNLDLVLWSIFSCTHRTA